ncbi:MAG: hypothetical protein ABIO36_04150, partial [Pyrinomonadaceae bacterium]
MNKIRIVLFALLVFSGPVAAFAQTPTLLKRTTVKTDRFDLGSGGTIAITGAPNGSIRVTGTSKNEIDITAEIEIQAGSEADLAKLAEVTGFGTDESVIRTSVISVGVHNKFGLKKLPKNFPKTLLGLPFTINYVIKVPHYCDLEIDGGKGDLSVSGVEGSMRINFLESSAKIEIVGGNTAITIGKGDLDVAFGVRGWRGRSANIQVAVGNLIVRLPSNLNAEIDAAISKSGAIDNKLPELKPRERKVQF